MSINYGDTQVYEAVFDPQAPHASYDDFLKEARGMSRETIKWRLEQLRNLSDDPEEAVSTAGMELGHSALIQALEEKDR